MTNSLKPFNMSQITSSYTSSKSSKLALTEKYYIETLILNDTIKDGYSFTPMETEIYRLDFLSGTKLHITDKFHSQISTYPLSARIKVIQFICGINLLEGYKFKTGTVYCSQYIYL